MKIVFLDDLITKKLEGRTRELFTGQRCLLYLKGSSKPTMIAIDSGFRTDFASIPRPLWPFIPPTGNYDRAAVLHDYFYRNTLISRPFADQVFLAGMKADGVGPKMQSILYSGVRVGGWVAWRRHERKNQGRLKK